MFRKGTLQSNHPCFHKMSLSAQMKKVGGHSYHMAVDSLSLRSDVRKYHKSPQGTSIPSQLLKSEIHVVQIFREVSWSLGKAGGKLMGCG